MLIPALRCPQSAPGATRRNRFDPRGGGGKPTCSPRTRAACQRTARRIFGGPLLLPGAVSGARRARPATTVLPDAPTCAGARLRRALRRVREAFPGTALAPLPG